MSLHHNPKVITSGLGLSLSAGNKKSYPGSGTAWTDMSGNGRSMTIVNPTYSSLTGGYLNFQSATTNSVQSIATNYVTVDVWVRVNSHGNWNNIVSNNWVNSGWLLFSDTTRYYFSVGSAGGQNSSSNLHSGSTAWVHLCGTYDGATVKLYVNGVLASTTASYVGGTLDTGYNISINAGNVGSVDVSEIKIYNIALSAAQVRQNFQALRGKFSL
jgi:hypothetical protein